MEGELDAVVAAPRALVDGAVTGPVAVRIRGGRFVDVTEGSAGATEELPGGLLTAGLVDVQINGAFGVDFADVDPAGLRTVAESLPSTGVTRFLPTLITAPVPVLLRQAHAVLAASAALPTSGVARPLGLHLEGPFLSPARHGVHDVSLMAAPDPSTLDRLLADETVAAALRVVTMAPELPGGLEAVRRLVDAGVVVSVGHSDATAAQAVEAADAGATMVTHLFNAQRPLLHREPGVPGIALTDDRFIVGLIADLAHVAAPVCRLVFAAAGPRVALVTDAVAAAGMPPGHYRLGGEDVVLTDDGVPRSPEGTIAGSALTLDRAVRNIVSIGVSERDALLAATSTPADAVGEKWLGRIAPGAVADLVWWDDDLRPRKVWIDGEVAFDADAAEPPRVTLSSTPNVDLRHVSETYIRCV
jgi:N-acetylglucosamine-6-phosphate deacetylase